MAYETILYDKDTQDKGIAEIEIAKQRSGPLGRIRAKFDKEFTLFKNIEGYDPSNQWNNRS